MQVAVLIAGCEHLRRKIGDPLGDFRHRGEMTVSSSLRVSLRQIRETERIWLEDKHC
jgi:hypothetical protein